MRTAYRPTTLRTCNLPWPLHVRLATLDRQLARVAEELGIMASPKVD